MGNEVNNLDGLGLGSLPAAAWYCLHCQPKHDHIAAAHLRRVAGVEVFFPRLRLKRVLRGRPTEVVEPLFPGYLFVQFNLASLLAQISHAPGVSNIVHFGPWIPTVPAAVIIELQEFAGAGHIRSVDTGVQAGDGVRIVCGAFQGLEAIVTRAMPARQRVAVLLDFLGRQVMVEMQQEWVLKAAFHPLLQSGAAQKSPMVLCKG
jgi:transcriptional antiterminator RfaH